MYKGFIIDNFDISDFSEIRKNTLRECIDCSLSVENKFLVNDSFKESLSKFIIQDSINKDIILDGSKIIDDYFPDVKADIFISHSHKDVEKAKELAKLIYIKTGLISFIDSEVWKYVDDLLNDIDDKFCPSSPSTYSYKKRNISTSYVHMMLNTALLNMIDRCECLLFLNTPNSFNVKQEIEKTTFSPWIYSELSMANAIEKKIPDRYRRLHKSLTEESVAQFSQEDSFQFMIALKPKTEKLINCDCSIVAEWLSECTSTKKLSNLDLLYKRFSRS